MTVRGTSPLPSAARDLGTAAPRPVGVCWCATPDPGAAQARRTHKHICLPFCISDTIFAKKLWCCEGGEGRP